jgi:hypothetical protein
VLESACINLINVLKIDPVFNSKTSQFIFSPKRKAFSGHTFRLSGPAKLPREIMDALVQNFQEVILAIGFKTEVRNRQGEVATNCSFSAK